MLAISLCLSAHELDTAAEFVDCAHILRLGLDLAPQVGAVFQLFTFRKTVLDVFIDFHVALPLLDKLTKITFPRMDQALEQRAGRVN